MAMFQKIIVFLLLFLFIFSFNSCKKYEDGPGISFRPKVNRLAGVWEVVELQDAFTGDLLNYNFSEINSGTTTDIKEIRNITIEFEKNGNYILKVTAKNTTIVTDIGGGVISTSSVNSTDFDKGVWEFSDDKESIKFRANDPYHSYLIDLLDVGNYIDQVGIKISRLTKKEFNYSDDYGNIWKLEKQ